MTSKNFRGELQLVDFHSAVRSIGIRAIGEPEEQKLGGITLALHQVDAVARLRGVIQRHGGALFADDVGMGKTFVSLAVARRYDRVHVIAPAVLLPMWRNALRQTESTHVLLHSLHRVSQRENSLPSVPASESVLVIVDEAHHLRTATTLRYSRVAEFVVGHDLLLVSATPIHNSERDLRTLLALFLGSRADVLDDESLARLVVRRGSELLTHDRLPDVVEQPPIAAPFDEATLHEIMALPDPLPARGGSTAGALIRLGLLRAWCSSDAALTHSIRLRRLRGEALAHALKSGRYPGKAELRAWIVADSSVQLAFTELLVQEAATGTPLVRLLEHHLDALAELQVNHCKRSRGDGVRAAALRDLLDGQPDRPIVAFSQFTETVRALYRALSDIAGVASIAGREARIASGRVPRSEVLWRIAPRAHGRPPPDERGRVRLLLSTDLLSEGVNLQEAGTVVHLDLPWTDALKRQRIGRCARFGALFDPVYIVSFAPPAPVDTVIRLSHTLERKAGLAASLVGSSTMPHRSAPEIATQIRQQLLTWRNITVTATMVEPDAPVLAFGRGTAPGWMAVVDSDGVTRMVVGCRGTTSEAQSHVLAFLKTLQGPAAGPERPREREALELRARHELQQWIETNEVDFMFGQKQRAISVAQRAVMAKMSDLVAAAPAPERAQLAVAAAVAERLVLAAKKIGAERALEAWLSVWSPVVPTREWLRAWRRIPSLSQVGLAMTRMTRIDPHSPARVTALLVVEGN